MLYRGHVSEMKSHEKMIAEGKGNMERLTTNKDVSEMSMIELAYNSCYVKDRKARYRDYDTDIDARELTRNLLETLADDAFIDNSDETFDDVIVDYLQYGTGELVGLIATFYRQICAIADLRERLKKYEDLEEQGKLLKLPCAVGDTVWDNDFGQPCSYTVTGFSFGKINDEEENDIEGLQVYYRNWNGSIRCSCAVSEIGKTVFLTQKEAETALKELEGW